MTRFQAARASSERVGKRRGGERKRSTRKKTRTRCVYACEGGKRFRENELNAARDWFTLLVADCHFMQGTVGTGPEDKEWMGFADRPESPTPPRLYIPTPVTRTAPEVHFPCEEVIAASGTCLCDVTIPYPLRLVQATACRPRHEPGTRGRLHAGLA